MRNVNPLILILVLFISCCSTVPEKKKTPTNVSLIKVYKAKRILEVYEGKELVKTYKIALGQNPVGHKHFEGDSKTPEGKYFINGKNDKSKYHKNLGVSYPNQSDKAYAKKYNKSAGGDIKIHGLPNGKGNIGRFHLTRDWTAGCIAVTDQEIDELYKAVQVKTPIHIFP